jgi:ankyrin repeat protein
MDHEGRTAENAPVSATADDEADVAALLHALRLTAAARQPPASSLTAAAVQGDVDLVRAFLDAGSDVEERSIGFASPLQAAAGRGLLDVVEVLLARGADPRQKADAVYSPLSSAAMHGHLDVAVRLMDAIGDLAGESKAVLQAAAHGHAECLGLLLERGASPGEHAGHVLRLAARRGHFACVKRLLAAGVDPRAHPDYALDLFGQPADAPYLPHQAALDEGHVHVAALLAGAPVDETAASRVQAKKESPATALAQLAAVLRKERGEAEEVPPLEGEARRHALARALERIRAGAVAGDPDRRGPAGRPLLVLAADAGEAELVDALLAAGASPSAAPDDGDTALIAAARWAHRAVVARLLATDTDTEARNAERMTALMAAAGRGDLECVRLLLAAGADPDARVRGRSARGFAVGVHKKAIRGLLEQAAERRAQS